MKKSLYVSVQSTYHVYLRWSAFRLRVLKLKSNGLTSKDVEDWFHIKVQYMKWHVFKNLKILSQCNADIYLFAHQT